MKPPSLGPFWGSLAITALIVAIIALGTRAPGFAAALLFALFAALYFLPALLAQGRTHPNLGAIFALNLLLGWTLLGWVIALVWALASAPIAGPAESPRGRLPCPFCAERILPTAVICRFCGTKLPSGWSRRTTVLELRSEWPESEGRDPRSSVP
jgi:Superinfection immunity protein